MSWDVVNRISRYISGHARTSTVAGKIYESVAYGTGTPKIYTVTSGATANTFGSYVEIEDSLSAESELCSCVIGTAGNVEVLTLEFATGAEGSESVFARISLPITKNFYNGSATVESYTGVYYFNPRIKLPAGTRVSARASDGEASAYQHNISVQWYQGLETI